MNEEIVNVHSAPLGGLPVFRGARGSQTGGGFFSGLARFTLPILKTVGKHALNVAKKSAVDVIQGRRGIKDALMSHGLSEVRDVINSPAQQQQQQQQQQQPQKRRRRKKQGGYKQKRLKRDIFSK